MTILQRVPAVTTSSVLQVGVKVSAELPNWADSPPSVSSDLVEQGMLHELALAQHFHRLRHVLRVS